MPKNSLKIIERSPNAIRVSIGKKTLSFIKVGKNLVWIEISPPGKGKKKEWISEKSLGKARRLARELIINPKT